MPDYRTIITSVGQTKLAAAILGPAIVLETMAVGDASGVGYDPDEAQVALVNQVYSAVLDSVETEAGGIIVCEMTIPANQGGWHVREACVKDDDGDIIAICRIADRYKPLPASGQADELTIRMKLDVGNVGNVNWIVDLTRKAKMEGQLRPDFRSVNGILADPPADPVPGDTYIVGDLPTGAWAGRAKQLAEWSGTGWTFVIPPDFMLVGLPNQRHYIYNSGSGGYWNVWEADPELFGPVLLATVEEARAGINNTKAVTPAGLADAVKFRQLSYAFDAAGADFTTTSTTSVTAHSLGVPVPDEATEMEIIADNDIRFTNNSTTQNGIGGTIDVYYQETGGSLTLARSQFVEVASNTNADERLAINVNLSKKIPLSAGTSRTVSIFVNINCADFEFMSRKAGSSIAAKCFSTT